MASASWGVRRALAEGDLQPGDHRSGRGLAVGQVDAQDAAVQRNVDRGGADAGDWLLQLHLDGCIGERQREARPAAGGQPALAHCGIEGIERQLSPVCRSLQAQQVHAGRVGRQGQPGALQGRLRPERPRGALGPGRSCQGAGRTRLEQGRRDSREGHTRLAGQGGRLALGRQLHATPGSRQPDSQNRGAGGQQRAFGRHRGIQGAGDRQALRQRRHQGGEAARQLAVQRHHVRGFHVRLHVLETAVRQACQRRREHHTTGVAPTWQGGKGLDGEPQPDAVRSGMEVGDKLDVGGGQHLVGPPEGHGSDCSWLHEPASSSVIRACRSVLVPRMPNLSMSRSGKSAEGPPRAGPRRRECPHPPAGEGALGGKVDPASGRQVGCEP